MAARNAAPPTPWSRRLAEPKIDETAYVHSFSNIIGDVRIGANVLIAPGTSIRADQGNPFHIGQHTHVNDGVVIHGLEQGRVIGDDDHSYSVWIGNHTSIAHMALIHGPAYVGDQCFIGFRSTIFNARVGDGCVVMMHVLIQDVEVPSGKLVPSGAIVTTQEQADRLPDVSDRDRAFAAHVISINQALRSSQSATPQEPGYHCADTVNSTSPIKEMNSTSTQQTTASSSATNGSTMNGEIINHVRQLLAQGYRIGTEHADQRQFRTSSWKSCATIQTSNESAVLAELQSCLAEHSGEYVRLIGIDPKVKRRVLETIIQRPGEAPAKVSSNGGSYSSQSYNPSVNRPPLYTPDHRHSGGLDPAIAAQVRQVLAKGGRIGMEHADERRFQTSSWKSCTPISATNESAVVAGLQACMAEHQGEYVRLIGIDPKAKRRILEAIIQRPGNKQVTQHTKTSSSGGGAYGGSQGGASQGGAALGGGIAEQVNHLVAQGATIGLEYADERHFRASSWQTAPVMHGNSAAQVMNALNSFLAEHQNHYVRLVGIDPRAKKRIAETIIQRPGKPASVSSNGASSSSSSGYGSSNHSRSHGQSGYGAPSAHQSGSSNGSGRLNADVVNQIRQFVNQGYRIGLEYANQRRYKTSSWQTATTVQTHRDSDAIAKIESALAQHPGDYVRIIGIDPNAKRRVAEVLIQQPKK